MDDSGAEGRQAAFPACRVVDDVGAVEAGAQDGGVGDLAAVAAADAGLVDAGHRVVAQRVVKTFEGQRGAAGQADAGVIAGADVLIDAKARGRDATALFDRLRAQWFFAPLFVQHAFGGGDDDLGAGRLGGEGFNKRVAQSGDIIGVVDLADPIDPDALDGL